MQQSFDKEGNTIQNSGPKRPPLFPASDVVFYVLIGFSLGIGLYVLPSLPEEIAPHFSADGEPTRYETPHFTIWFLPLLTAGLVFFMNLVLWASMYLEEMMNYPPKPKNEHDQKKFSRHYASQSKRIFFWIKLFLVMIMIGIYFYILYWNLPGTNPDQLLLQHGISLLLCLFFIGFGIVIYRSQMPPNIPWWEESPPPKINRMINKRLGISFFICGILILLFSFLDGTIQSLGTMISVIFLPLAGTVWGIMSGQKEWRKMREGEDFKAVHEKAEK